MPFTIKNSYEGVFSKEISNNLSISVHTVNNHRQNILQKMNTDNVVGANNLGRKLGLMDYNICLFTFFSSDK